MNISYRDKTFTKQKVEVGTQNLLGFQLTVTFENNVRISLNFVNKTFLVVDDYKLVANIEELSGRLFEPNKINPKF